MKKKKKKDIGYFRPTKNFIERERGQSYTICTKEDNENVVDYI